MGWQIVAKIVEYDHTDYDRSLTGQFIHRPGDKGMMCKIFRKVSAVERIEDATSER